MGNEAHSMFTKVKKVLQGKNEKSTTMAGVLEDLIAGKPIPGLDKPKQPEPEPKSETEESEKEEPPKPKPLVDSAALNAGVLKIQEKMEADAQEREAEAKLKLTTVVEKLRERMAQMKENLEEKNRRDQKAAVEKYMME